MNEDTEKARTILLEFMSAMKEWENKFVILFDRQHGGMASHYDQAEAELRPIYEKYLAVTDKGPLAVSPGYPPQFDPDAEKVVKSELPKADKVIIETLWTHPKVPSSTRQHRYILIKMNGEWRLDKVEYYLRNKWKRITL